jgi:uncharacterized membrane protein
MTLLVALIFLFGLAHIVPAVPAMKSAAVSVLGKAYGPAYGILSLLLLIAVLWAFRQTAPETLYEVSSWGRHADFTLSLVGFIFIGIFLFRGSWRNRIKYPMAIGVAFWSLGHLLANGDQRTTVLFAGLAAFAILHAILKATQGAHEPSVERQGHNMLSILAGIVLYGLAAQLHGVMAGVPVVTLQ